MDRLSGLKSWTVRPRRPDGAMRPGRSWVWAWGGSVLGLLIAVVGCAPARWLTDSLTQLSQQRLQWQQVRGTVWSGSAQLVLSGGLGSQDAVALPGRIAWSLRPQAPPGIALSLALPCCTDQPLQAQLLAGWSGLHLLVKDGQSHWPAAVLAGLGTPWNTLQAQGQIQIRTDQLELSWAQGRMLVTGQATLGLMDLSSRLSTLRPMGSYRLRLQGSQGDAPARIQLDTLTGRLQLQGRGEWIGGRWRFEGEASAAPEHEAALSNLLNVLGQRQGSKALLKMG